MGHGGARPGAGCPKGTKTKKTIDKELKREALRRIILKHMNEMVAAQIANSMGLKYLMVRERATGKFTRVTEENIKAFLAGQEEGTHEIAEIWIKDPSVQAFTDLMNRALDKPKEQELEVKVTGVEELVKRLASARKRKELPPAPPAEPDSKVVH